MNELVTFIVFTAALIGALIRGHERDLVDEREPGGVIVTIICILMAFAVARLFLRRISRWEREDGGKGDGPINQ